MSIKLFSYKNGSASAKALRDALGIKMLATNGKWVGKRGDVIINWGSSKQLGGGRLGMAEYVNKPAAVGIVANKLEFMHTIKDKDYCLPYLTGNYTPNQMIGLLKNDGVVCRTILNGHSGAGIVLANTLDEVVKAPLYTKYVKKQDEYRIHVMDGAIIDVQRKARRRDVEDDKVNWKVRNLDGGFIFARDGIVAPLSVRRAALDVVGACGLVHGAVDIGYHPRLGTFVYEVNTACGLAGSTLQTYALAFAKLLNIPKHQLRLPLADDEYVPCHPDNHKDL